MRYTVPGFVDPGDGTDKQIKFRVGAPIESGVTVVSSGGQEIYREKKAHRFLPSNMEIHTVACDALKGCTAPLTVRVEIQE